MLRRTISTLLTSLLLATVPFAQAADKKTAKKDDKKPSTSGKATTGRDEAKKAFLEKYDTNKDGKLDEKERKVANWEARKKKKSNKLTYEELVKRRLLYLFDKNKDGQLDAKEQATARKAIAKQQQASYKRMQQMFRRMSRGRRGGGRRGGGGRGGNQGGFQAYMKLQKMQLQYLKAMQKAWLARQKQQGKP